MDGLLLKLRDTLRRWRLWQPGEKLLLAVSGGIDSMVMADLIRRLPPAERPRVTVAHYNHRLRGRESEGDARLVKKICEAWGFPVVIGKAPVWKSKQNLQERARELRYRFFAKVAKKIGADKVATAHQADDQAETFLIRWVQGAGLKGLAGIPIRGPLPIGPHPTYGHPLPPAGEGLGVREIVRPLLFMTRTEIAGYAKKFKVPYREDSSNRKTDYLRNQVRRLLTRLKKINPDLPHRSQVNAQLLRADDDFIAQELRRELGKKHFPVARYLSLPEALRYRLLRQMGQSPGGDFIFKLDALIRSTQPKLSYDLPRGVRFVKQDGCFSFARKG